MRISIDMANERVRFADDDGKVLQEYELLFPFSCEDTQREYVFYTDGTEDEQGNMRIFVARYDPEDMSAETDLPDDEFAMLEKLLERLMDDDDEPEAPQPDQLRDFVSKLMDEIGEDVELDDGSEDQ